MSLTLSHGNCADGCGLMGGHGGYGPALTPIGKNDRDDALDASGQYDASGQKKPREMAVSRPAQVEAV